MTADELLIRFDRIADAPNAVPRLRKFILDLAVRGKLVQQENDGNVSELLKSVATERGKRIAMALVKPAQPLPKVTRAEVDSEIPARWEWVRLGNVAEVLMGHSPPGETYRGKAANKSENTELLLPDESSRLDWSLAV